MNHTISDFVIRIKNAAMAKRKEVLLPFSKMNLSIGKILVHEGFLKSIKETAPDGARRMLIAYITYEKQEPILNSVRIVSKPSLRVYIGSKDIAGVERKGRKTTVLSTNIGVMSGKDAKKKGVGGELLFEIS